MELNVFGPVDQDRLEIPFTAADSGTEPLTWGEKAILQDMRASGNQFTISGRLDLPEGSTVADAAARLTGVVCRHTALRMRLEADGAGRLVQHVSGSGQLSLDILTLPDDADRSDAARYAVDLMENWPEVRFDFHRDWPLRMAVVRHRGACLSLVWALSHLAADGGAHLLLLDDLLNESGGARDGRRPQLLDVARSEQEPQLRQLSARAMRHWEAQLRHIPAQTFAEPVPPADRSGQRHAHVRFTSPAAHLAMLAIARRTGSDLSRVTLGLIATAIARATGVTALTLKVMVNNRFRPGLAEVIAPIAQNSVVTIDVGDASLDEVVARARAAALTAAMRAYCDPDELSELTAVLDAERGHPAAVTCRVNDQRAMVMRADEQLDGAEVTPAQIAQLLSETSLNWLGPRENMHEQANIVIENRPGIVSLWLIWDLWSLTNTQVEAILRGVETVAVEAAFDPDARTQVCA
jgi:hypothetical protein